MLDDNIRRLLHYSTSERRGNAPSDESRRGKPERKALRHFAILKRDKERSLNELTEASLRRLGTRVLWVDGFGEIPDRLAYLYNQNGDNWQDIFA